MADARALTHVIFDVTDDNGDPLSGGKVYAFETGTTTPKTTWTDADKGTPNAHPVVLDANGRANIWIDSTGGQYRIRVDDANDVIIWGPIDKVDGMAVANVGGDSIFTAEHQSDGSHGGAFVWDKGADIASAATLTLGTDGNAFDITGTTTVTAIATLGVGTRVLLHFDGALTLTHNATDLVLPGGVNIITRAGDEFEFFEYATGDWRLVGGNNRTFNGVMKWIKGADVASATALPVISDGNYFDVTGTTTVTSINALGIGTPIKLHFDDAVLLTHHSTNLVLPGGVNITTVAGDELEFTEYAAGDWRMTGGNAANLAITSAVLSGNLTAVDGIFSGNVTISGAAPSTPVANRLYKDNIVKAWLLFNGTGTIAINDSFNVTSIADSGTGDYAVTWETDFANTNYTAVASAHMEIGVADLVAGINSYATGTIGVDVTDVSAHAAADSATVAVIALGDQ